MGVTAQLKTFGPFWYAGNLVTAPRLYHYAAGTSTLKPAWVDRAKVTEAEQPIVGDANGMIFGFFFDGLYKFQVRLSDDITVIATLDNFDVTEAVHRLEASIVWNPGNLADGAGETSPSITVQDAAFGDYVLVAAPYDLQSVDARAFVTAANTVKIRLQNETGGAVDLASGTWTVRILRA